MAGWRKIVRGMVGTGLTFGFGIGGVTLALGLVAVALGNATVGELRFAGRAGVVGFLLGVGFSGILAVSARSRRLTELSFARFTLMGAGAGIAYFLLIATNAFRVWTPAVALENFLLLTMMGGAAAAATLFIARKARPEPDSSGNVLSQTYGDSELNSGNRVDAMSVTSQPVRAELPAPVTAKQLEQSPNAAPVRRER